MKRNLIPPFLVLFTGLIASVIMFFLNYETKTMLIILLGVLVVFYIIGSLFKFMLDFFYKQNAENKKKMLKEDEEAEEIQSDEGENIES